MAAPLTPATYDEVQHPRSPMLYCAAAFAFGIAISSFVWRPATWWVLAGILFAAAGLYLGRFRVWLPRTIALVTIAFLGVLNIQLRPADIPDCTILAYADGRELELTAHVVDPGKLNAEISSSGNGRDQRLLVVETESVRDGETIRQVQSRIRLNLYSTTSGLHFDYGMRVRIMAKLHPPHNFRNPGAFDFEGYLHSKGIVALASAKADSVQLLPGFFGNRIEWLRISIRSSVLEHVHTIWPTTQAALIDAMVIGDDAFIDPETRVEFQRSGTYHILVVSGMNLGILVATIFWVLRRLRVRELAINALAIIVAVSYAFLTDAGAPIWRATFMLILYLAARFFHRERSMLNAIGVAGLGLLVVDPAALFSPSFQLTFLAVLIIAGIGVPVLERTSQPFVRGLRALEAVRYDAQLPPRVAQLRLDLRLIASRFRRWASGRYALISLGLAVRAGLMAGELLFISALIQAGLALPMAVYFHRATSMGLLANLAVVPLTSILMPFAAIALGLSYISAHLAQPFAWLADLALRGISGTVRFLGGAQLADVRVATPGIAVIVGASLAILVAMWTVRRRRLPAAIGLLVLVASALLITIAPPKLDLHRGSLEVTAIDVGQGDATLIVSPEGRTLLVDSGGLPHWMHSSFDIGEQVVSNYLWSRHIHQLDAVAITHAHADHMGGMATILKNFKPRELWLGVDTGSQDLRELLEIAHKLQIQIIFRAAGDEFRFGQRTRIQIFAPQRDNAAQSWRANDDSLVMKLSLGQTSVLMEGDAERQVEARVALEDAQATLLKVAHHGSATSTIPVLLKAVHPQYAIISVGFRNTYGHPRTEVLARLAAAHVITYRTDLTGALTFYLDGRGVTTSFPALH